MSAECACGSVCRVLPRARERAFVEFGQCSLFEGVLWNISQLICGVGCKHV